MDSARQKSSEETDYQGNMTITSTPLRLKGFGLLACVSHGIYKGTASAYREHIWVHHLQVDKDIWKA
jgi:hypothetical protein